MKKLMIFIVLLVMVGVSFAQDTENYVVIDQPTNVRSAPLVGHVRRYIVRAVVSHTKLPVMGRNFEGIPECTGILNRDNRLWLQVSVDGIEGWVKFCENDFVGNLSLIPQSQPQNPETRLCASAFRFLDELGNEPSITYLRATTRDYRINLRAYPNIASERIDLLTSSEVYIIGRSPDGTWVKISYEAMVATCGYRNFNERTVIEGWVAGFLLDLPDGWQDIVPIVES